MTEISVSMRNRHNESGRQTDHNFVHLTLQQRWGTSPPLPLTPSLSLFLAPPPPSRSSLSSSRPPLSSFPLPLLFPQIPAHAP